MGNYFNDRLPQSQPDTLSGYPLGSDEDNAYHRATGEQVPEQEDEERLTREPGYVTSFDTAIRCLRAEADYCRLTNRVARESMLRAIANELEADLGRM